MSIHKTVLAVWQDHRREYIELAQAYLAMGEDEDLVTGRLLSALQADIPILNERIDRELTWDQWPAAARAALEEWDNDIAQNIRVILRFDVRRIARQAARQVSLAELEKLRQSTLPARSNHGYAPPLQTTSLSPN